jgi:signal transduction histidine kinase
MDDTPLDRIARELLDLLNQQVAAIAGRKFDDLSAEERLAYEKRRERILELRSEIEKLL